MYKKIGFYKCSDCFDESGSVEWQFWSTSFIVKSNSPHMSNTNHLFKSSSVRFKWYESLSCAIGTSGEYDTFEWNKGQHITWLHLIRQLDKCTEVFLSSGATRLSCTTGEIASQLATLRICEQSCREGALSSGTIRTSRATGEISAWTGIANAYAMNILRSISFINDKHSMHETESPHDNFPLKF